MMKIEAGRTFHTAKETVGRKVKKRAIGLGYTASAALTLLGSTGVISAVKDASRTDQIVEELKLQYPNLPSETAYSEMSQKISALDASMLKTTKEELAKGNPVINLGEIKNVKETQKAIELIQQIQSFENFKTKTKDIKLHAFLKILFKILGGFVTIGAGGLFWAASTSKKWDKKYGIVNHSPALKKNI